MVVNVLRKFIPGDEVTFKIANRWGRGIIYCVSLSLLEDIYQYSIKETGGGVVNADEKDIKLIKRRQGEDVNQSAENNLLEHKFQVGDLVRLTFNSIKKEGIITGQEGLDDVKIPLYAFKSNEGELYSQVCEYFLVHTSALAQPKFKLGEKIEFWYNNEWCPGTILRIDQKEGNRTIYTIRGGGKARNENLYGSFYRRGEMGIRERQKKGTNMSKEKNEANDFAKQSPKHKFTAGQRVVSTYMDSARPHLTGPGTIISKEGFNADGYPLYRFSPDAKPHIQVNFAEPFLNDDLTMRILSNGCSDYIETDNPTYTTADSGIIIDWDKTFEQQNDKPKQDLQLKLGNKVYKYIMNCDTAKTGHDKTFKFKPGQTAKILIEDPLSAPFAKGDVVEVLHLQVGNPALSKAYALTEPVYRVKCIAGVRTEPGNTWDVNESAMELVEDQKNKKKDSAINNNVGKPGFISCSGLIIDWDKTFELQNDFAKQSPKSEPEHSEGLIPNPCPTGRYYLPGTGHHFDTYEGKTIYFDKDDNVIPNGNEHTVGATADTFCYLPDNLKFNNMNREDIKLINNGVYRNRRLSQEYERLQREQKRERKLLRRENRRKVWRKAKQWILITTIATVIFGASFDYKHGCTPRGWVKGVLSYVGYQLQALGNEQNLTK